MIIDYMPETKNPTGNHTIKIDGAPQSYMEAECLRYIMSDLIFWPITDNTPQREDLREPGFESYRSQFFDLPYGQGAGWTFIDMNDQIEWEFAEWAESDEKLENELVDWLHFNKPEGDGWIITNISVTYGYQDSFTSIWRSRIFARWNGGEGWEFCQTAM